MEALKVIAYIGAAGVVLYLLHLLLKKLFNYVTVDDYEYLELISHVEWRSGRDIRNEMMRRKKGNIYGSVFFEAMGRLEARDLIEGRYEIVEVWGTKVQRRQYKKTPGGIRKQNELHLQERAVIAGMPAAS